MQFAFVLIMPYTFIGDKLIPGHKKDFFMLASKLIEANKSVEILYSKKNKLYDWQGNLKEFTLKDILLNLAYSKSVVIIGPLHSFRYTLFLKKNRKIYYYVFDSILKTSIFAFMNNYIYIYRIVYALIIEILLKKYDILVSSLEEYTWFSSSGRPKNNVFLMTPLPDKSVDFKEQNKIDQKSVLFFNPSGAGIKLAIDMIEKISTSTLDANIIITGQCCEYIKSIISPNEKIQFINFSDNISELISKCTLVVLTDMEGSGFCNRALQVRHNNVRLLCTLPSVRGTGLLLDPGVQIFQTSENGFEQIISMLSNKDISDKFFVNRSIIRSCLDIDHFMRSTQSSC